MHQVISYYYSSVSVTVGQFSFWQLSVVLCRYLNVQPISFWSAWKCFLQHEIQIMLSLFNNIYYYRLTRTLAYLTAQTDLSRTDEWSWYAIAFNTLLPKGITKYMYDWGYLLDFYHHEIFIIFHLYKLMTGTHNNMKE